MSTYKKYNNLPFIYIKKYALNIENTSIEKYYDILNVVINYYIICNYSIIENHHDIVTGKWHNV